ncbi:ABC transporter permease [Cytobacillus sp. Hz8]|uniref:ABC transporter permease n=1 Tax=Cytobacillus sp. Hz8 TaxID=3347168 RepID=UPI0035E0DD59
MEKIQSDVQILPKVKSIQHSLIKLPGIKWLLLVIPLVYVLVLLYISMVNVLMISVKDENGFTLSYLKEVLTGTLYLRVLWITIKISLLVTAFSLLIGYPVAYFVVITKSKFWQQIMLGTVLTTLWISLLARTFSWQVILQEYGALNKLLMTLGIINQPLHLLYNTWGVVIGMTHILIPYMILSLHSVMEGIDRRLLQAAQGLGAKPIRAFFQIFLPLSMPGITSGSLMVFVLGLGYFITPSILGGQNNMVIAKLIQENIQMSLNWHLASALSLLLLVTTLLLLGLSLGLTKLFPFMRGGK